MKPYLRWLIVMIAIIVAVLVLRPYFSSQSSRAGFAGLAGRPAPVFDLRDDRGRAVSLAQYRGSIVVMNLWASWCPPCRAEMPDLQRLVAAQARHGVVVVGVNEGESEERGRDFADALRIQFPIWMDSGQQYGRAYQAPGLPTTVLVDRHGVVLRAYDGALTLPQMQAAVKLALQSS